MRITNISLLDESESHILALKVVYHVHCVQSCILISDNKNSHKINQNFAPRMKE